MQPFAFLKVLGGSILPLGMSGLCLVSTSVGDAAMNPKVVQQTGFNVIGISARTSNAKEMTPDGVIGKQWAQFIQDGV